MARKRRGPVEDVETRINRLVRESRKDFRYPDLVAAGWEPGQVPYLEHDGLKYERFFPQDGKGGFVLVEWDDDGNVSC
jgi:hypothetical protein